MIIYMYMYIWHVSGDKYLHIHVHVHMKSTKVQTFGAVTLHATTAYTDVLHVVGSVHVRMCTCYSLIHICAYVGPLLH